MDELAILEPVTEWRAQWIWCDAEERPRNAYAYFRKTFQLEGAAAAPVRVSADNRYLLYVNGRRVAHGPARCDRRWQSFDELDLAPYLREGENVIAAVVHHLGEVTAQTMQGRAALLLEGEAGAVRLDTDGSWRALRAEAWERNLRATMNVKLDFWEVFDSRKEPAGWREPGFDDSAWAAATVIGRPPCEPWPRMAPRDIPFLREDEALRPVRRGQRGTFAEGQAADPLCVAEVMAARRRLASGEAEEPTRPHQRPQRPDEMTLEAGEYVVLDFGIEVTGYLEVSIAQAGAGATLDIGYAERLEANGAINPARAWCLYADRLICRGTAQAWGPFERRAFRYVMVDCVAGEVTVEELALRLSVYPAEWHESFASPDPRLRDIWRLGTYTLQLNMEDAYTDCPWRERGQWSGDIRVQALMNYYAFGDYALARRWLFQTAQSQDEQGKVKAFVPTDQPRYIPGFMLLWICGIADYALFSGDLESAARLLPAARRTLAYFERFADGDGLLTEVPDWNFIDWSPMEAEGTSTALNALYVMALEAAAQAAAWCGDDEDGWRARASRAKEAANRLLWDEGLGAYRDGRKAGALSRSAGQAANALCVVSGIAGERAARALDTIMDPGRLVPVFEQEQMAYVDFGKCEGKIIQVGTPYMSFYLLQALWQGVRAQQALDYIRAKWGVMLIEGDVATREMWKHSPVTSHAHGWGAAPTHDLGAHVLGARPAAPGWREAIVEPHLCDLEWARGEIPTPQGVMRVNCRQGGSGVKVEVEAPEGVSVRREPSF